MADSMNETDSEPTCHPGIVVSGLTSEVYNKSNPPTDWADLSLLIPHEPLREGLSAMEESVQALLNRTSAAAAKGDECDDAKNEDCSWRVVYFCEWVLDAFSPMIHTHHDNEEELYFPWIDTKANDDPAWVEARKDRYSADHEHLVQQLGDIEQVCRAMIQKRGQNCHSEIHRLHQMLPQFATIFREHLKEEEETVAPLLRKYFTQEEEEVVIQAIGRKDGVENGLKNYLCAILVSMRSWTTPEYQDEFLSSLPSPVRWLTNGYFLPDFENVTIAKRDAPLLLDRPPLRRQRCCKIPFCCRCAV